MDKDALYSMITIGCIIAGTIAIKPFLEKKYFIYQSYTLTKWYGFAIGTFSGVLGVGFYYSRSRVGVALVALAAIWITATFTFAFSHYY